MALYLKQLPLGPMENFVYLVGDAASDQVAVIDPAWDVDAIEQAAAADRKQIVSAFVSHCHKDHTNGVPELLKRRDIPVYAQKEELAFSEELRGMGEAMKALSPGDVVEVGPLKIRSLHTPGHTPGSQCLWCEDAVVSGDTVFVNACGRCDLRGGDPAAMHRTITQVLMQLPEQTRLLPGHDYGDVPISTLGREREKNPYFQLPSVQEFVAFRMRPRR